MKKILAMFSLLAVLLPVFFVVMPSFVQAVGVGYGLTDPPEDPDLLGTEYGQDSGLGNADPRSAVGWIIRGALSLLGVGGLIMFIYSGFEWMTAGGNDEKVRDAKKRIWYTLIGMLVIFSAYAITQMVYKIVYEASKGRFFN